MSAGGGAGDSEWLSAHGLWCAYPPVTSLSVWDGGVPFVKGYSLGYPDVTLDAAGQACCRMLAVISLGDPDTTSRGDFLDSGNTTRYGPTI